MRRGEGLPVSYKCRRPTNCDMPIKMILEGSERGAEGQNPEPGYCPVIPNTMYSYFVRV